MEWHATRCVVCVLCVAVPPSRNLALGDTVDESSSLLGPSASVWLPLRGCFVPCSLSDAPSPPPPPRASQGAFGQQQEKGDFQDLLEKMLDAHKIFFVGPSTQMRKQ